MKALIIVDVQNDFMPEGSLPIKGGNDILYPIINEAKNNYYNLIIASQDWHPINHNSFACNHVNKKDFDKITLNGKEQMLWPVHCVKNTKGAQLHHLLNDIKIDYLLKKGILKNRDSYSVFFDNQQKHATQLHKTLQKNKIDEITFCGLAGDFCIAYSVEDALKLGYKVRILSKGIRAISEKNYKHYLNQWKKQGVTIT